MIIIVINASLCFGYDIFFTLVILYGTPIKITYREYIDEYGTNDQEC